MKASRDIVAGFAVAVNNGSAEPAYYVDRMHQQRVQVQQQHYQQTTRYNVQPSHVSAPGKEILETPRRDLVYVHCATTEDEDAEEEEEEPKGLTRSRSWLCCPGDRSNDRTVPIQVEASHREKQQESVSWNIANEFLTFQRFNSFKLYRRLIKLCE